MLGKSNKNTPVDNECKDTLMKTLKSKGAALIVDDPTFSEDVYKKSGAFLQKRFWFYNLLCRSPSI